MWYRRTWSYHVLSWTPRFNRNKIWRWKCLLCMHSSCFLWYFWKTNKKEEEFSWFSSSSLFYLCLFRSFFRLSCFKIFAYLKTLMKSSFKTLKTPSSATIKWSTKLIPNFSIKSLSLFVASISRAEAFALPPGWLCAKRM